MLENDIAYCVTEDDIVYGFGEIDYKTEKGDNYSSNFVILKELCERNIEEFFNGNHCMFARSTHGHIYSWGWNDFGQLCRGTDTRELLRPKRIPYFDDKIIVQISTGFCYYHCLALSSEGQVYGWGDNCLRQLINIKAIAILNPILMPIIDERIKSIHCTDDNFHYLTYHGKLFCNKSGKYEDILGGEKLLNVAYTKNANLTLAEINKGLYVKSINGGQFIKSEYSNIIEFFILFYQITNTTIQMKKRQMLGSTCKLNKFTKVEKYWEIIECDSSKTKQIVVKDLTEAQTLNLKCFYKSSLFQFFIMNDDHVFVIGSAEYGKLGLGEIYVTHTLTEIPELSLMDIDEFFEGNDIIFARSKNFEIYSWGTDGCRRALSENWDGMLHIRKPHKIKYFEDKKIINICCNSSHCLALSTEGKVYSWGHNKEGQVGCGRRSEDVYEPVLLDAKYGISQRVQFIYASRQMSLAVDIKGKVYFWGTVNETYETRRWKVWIARQLRTTFNLLVQLRPKQLEHVDEVIKVNIIHVIDGRNECVLLRKSGSVYIYDLNKMQIKKEIEISIKIKDISSDGNLLLFTSKQWVYTFDFEREFITKTNSMNFYDYFSVKHKRSYKTIHIHLENNDGQEIKSLITKEICLNQNYPGQSNDELFVIKNKNLFDTKYINSFEIENNNEIGAGSFGTVYKVKHKITNENFAVKIIPIIGNLQIL